MLAVGGLLTACGSGAADELEALQASSAERIGELETQINAQATELGDLEGELATVIAAEAETADELAATVEALESAEGERDRAFEDLAVAEARTQELLNTYDAEIRADAQEAWDAEVARACESAGDGTAPIATFVTYTPALEPIGTETELVEAVEACAVPLRERSEEERLNDECEVGDPDELTRGTSSFVGDCLVVYAVPFQWDSRTGDCNFLGNWDGRNQGTRSWRYDGDGLFRAGATVCSVDLDGADQDDVLKLWVEVLGTYRYDTAAGGTNAVPEFEIRKAELVQKA